YCPSHRLEEVLREPESRPGNQLRGRGATVMAIVKVKPPSAGRRAMVKVVNAYLDKSRRFPALVEKQSKNDGRNNNGLITARRKGGGHKLHYRIVDFRRIRDGIPDKVERIEYDPNRSANIALICYADGQRAYIIAPRGLEVG